MDAVKVDHTPGQRAEKQLQVVSYNEKVKNNKEWFRNNIDDFISRSRFGSGQSINGTSTRDTDMQTLYGVYNNEFPVEWFSHITNPLSATDPKHTKFPAKIRPVTILRTNIDLLLGEYPRRPFVYNVENMGDTGYSRYMEEMKNTANQYFQQVFVQEALAQAQAMGQELTPEQVAQIEKDPGIPEQIKLNFKASYKDNMAIKGQRWLRRIIRQHEVRQKQHKMFKDWTIVGEAYSYKGLRANSVVYKRVSPLCISYDESDISDFIEDYDWVVCREEYSLSEVVDTFYETLKENDLKDLEDSSMYRSPQAFYSHYRGLWGGDMNKIPVYHVQWKGKKKVGFLSYIDMETFQLVEDVVDEDYVVNRERGEVVEWRWVNEVYEGYRIHDHLYTEMDAAGNQRNEINNISKCKLNYNGRRYSDTHSHNLSVLKIGIPFQIMYMILNYTLEKTIAKSKGKIMLIDLNAVPDNDDWDEEKFFYWAEAKGYALLDRTQIGVDKSWNQYQVLDMTLFESIKQLIELMDYYKQQWDDVIGITRQRKGQTYSSDGQGVNERSVFQSTVITDMIFIGFEEFVERELQGLLDLAKYATSEGVFKIYNDDDYYTQLLEIYPEDLMNEELGIFFSKASEELRKLEEMKGYAQAMLQNNQKPSTVLEVIDSMNVAELKAKLRVIEEMDAQMEQAVAENEAQMAEMADERKERYREFEQLLDLEFMHQEYDRKEDLEYIEGSFNTFSFSTGDSNANGIPDPVEVQKMNNDREKLMTDREDRRAARALEMEKISQKKAEFEQKKKMDAENVKLQKEKNKIARIKKKSSSK